MLFCGTERNQRGIFRKTLKRGKVVSTTVIDIVADLWKWLGVCSPLSLLANCSLSIAYYSHVASPFVTGRLSIRDDKRPIRKGLVN